MDAQEKYSQPLPDKLKEEVSYLKNCILNRQGLPSEDVQQMLIWLDCLQGSPFGCFLILNKKLNGSWLSFHKGVVHSFDRFLFDSLPALTAMKQRYETVKAALLRGLFDGKVIGVFPASYAEEWAFLQNQAKISVVGLQDKAELLLNEACFDVIVRNVFLYGDRLHDEDVYAYLFASLKPGGVLLTSTWVQPHDPQDVAYRQEILFFEQLLGMGSCAFHSVSAVKTLLHQAGFERIQILGAENGRLPSIIAKKPTTAGPPLKIKRTVVHAPRRISRKNVYCKIITPLTILYA